VKTGDNVRATVPPICTWSGWGTRSSGLAEADRGFTAALDGKPVPQTGVIPN